MNSIHSGMGWVPYDMVANALDYDILVGEFELLSYYYV